MTQTELILFGIVVNALLWCVISILQHMKINKHLESRINHLQKWQDAIIEDVLTMQRKDALESEDYRRVARIDEIMKSKDWNNKNQSH